MNGAARGLAAPVSGPSELLFAWRGIDAEGRRRRGRHIAPDAASARAALRAAGVVAFALAVRGTPTAAVPRPTAVTRLLAHLAALLQAGLPLLRALELIRGQASQSPTGRVAGALARAVASGSSLAAAMAAQPRVFAPLCVRLTAVGEASASLADVLARIAAERAQAAARRAKLRAALAYPVAVLALSLAVTCGLLAWVVPAFTDMFARWHAPLPAATRFVIGLSTALPRLALLAGAALLAALVLAAAARRRPALRLTLHRARLALPLAGPLAAALAASRWSRALGILLAAGVPVVAAFDTLRGITGDAAFDAATERVAAALLRGEPLAAALARTGRFPPDFVESVAVAEESATLDTMLLHFAALAEQTALDATTRLCGWAEPLVVSCVGLLTGGVVLAMYLPIIQLGDVV